MGKLLMVTLHVLKVLCADSVFSVVSRCTSPECLGFYFTARVVSRTATCLAKQ